MTRRAQLLMLSTCLLAPVAQGQAPAAGPAPGWVQLPLSEYVALADEAARRDRERSRTEEAPKARLLSQEAEVTVEEDLATIESELEIDVSGLLPPPLPLALPGWLETVSLTPPTGATVSRGSGGTLSFLATRPGRYHLKARSRQSATRAAGIRRWTFPATGAPVTSIEVRLAKELGWQAPGSVVGSERELDGGRILELVPPRNAAAVFEVRRTVAAGEEEQALARATAVTVVRPGSDRVWRHDVLLYEVLRGELSRFEVELPPGLEPEVVLSDESGGSGEGTGRERQGNRLIFERTRQLTGLGHLTLTTPLPWPGASLDLALPAIEPTVPLSARFLVFAAGVAAETQPLPESAWSRVDLADLPSRLQAVIAELRPTAVWRQTTPTREAALRLAAFPAVATEPALVRERNTTSLLSPDGRLVHRDRLRLEGRPASLALTLPAGASFWSALVDEVPVRPVERGGELLIPLGFKTGGGPIAVEVVTVETRPASRERRSRLRFDLPRLALPVLSHQWRLLLPEGQRYRLLSSDLVSAPPHLASTPTMPRGSAPIYSRQGNGGTARLYGQAVDEQGQALPGATCALRGSGHGSGEALAVVSNADGRFEFLRFPAGEYRLVCELEGFSTLDYPGIRLAEGRTTSVEVTFTPALQEVITVTSESPLLDERQVAREDRRRREERAEEAASRLLAEEKTRLSASLVAGVKPLAFELPEEGKILFLAGVLPGAEVSVALEVRRR